MKLLLPTESQGTRAGRRAASRTRPDAAADEAPRAEGARRGGRWTWWIAGAVILVVAGGVAWWATTGRAKVPSAQAPVLGQRIADEGWDHVAVGTGLHYRTTPPSSGPHYPFPAPAGVYQNGLQTGFWVHSLEHGYIVLLYRPPASQEHLATFDRMLTGFPKSKYGNVKLLIVPYSDMSHPFAVLAWDWRLYMDEFKEGTVLQFYKQHVDHGREDIP